MRKLLRSLLLELLPPPNNGSNSNSNGNNKNRRGSVIGAMAFRARPTGPRADASGGNTDDDANAAKRAKGANESPFPR